MAASCSKTSPQGGAPGDGSAKAPPPAAAKTAMPVRALGKTGVNVSLVGLGGFHIGTQADENESIRIIRGAVDRGINFLDNCWDYNGGKSEDRMGKALLDGYRQKIILMTKIDGRSREVAEQQIEQSLRRLRTDVIDLVQIHEVIRMEDPAACFREGGCVEALVAARKAGKIRFIGFTGHKDPDIHLAMLRAADEHNFAFDTLQMPLNVMDAHYRSFEKNVLPVAVKKGMGVLGMKPLGGGIILKSEVCSAVECLHYAMNLQTSCVITGCDSMEVLDQAIDAAVHFEPLSAAAVSELLARTREAAKAGEFEKFKTSQMFDGTVQNPQWLTRAEI